ncbi:carboxypeptidase-like regulatory domain-containing protein [uncultured Dokdonia sp.]|uniref:carboxypeptidase-like regulatory domain-containing protein n=1 Tax=uncultured Dokdonia sp. TaxID=575653 RepID=UPI0026070471|nr:carboxypeptidase-like regulatory domain-containing protein [uncultured Dokdonia sp.]
MKQITLLAILLYSLNTIIAQTTIQGTITDEISALEWANIHIKNSTTGTTSDANGNFKLQVQKGDTLVISYAGYQTKEIIIDTQKFIPITLDNELLDEIIVTAQSISRTKTIVVCGKRSRTFSCSSKGVPIRTILTNETTETLVPSLYPNPSSDGIFHLKMTTPYKDVKVLVTNLLGQQVQSKRHQNTTTSITLDLASARTGIYLIHMIADGERLPTQKAIRR